MDEDTTKELLYFLEILPHFKVNICCPRNFAACFSQHNQCLGCFYYGTLICRPKSTILFRRSFTVARFYFKARGNNSRASSAEIDARPVCVYTASGMTPLVCIHMCIHMLHVTINLYHACIRGWHRLDAVNLA